MPVSPRKPWQTISRNASIAAPLWGIVVGWEVWSSLCVKCGRGLFRWWDCGWRRSSSCWIPAPCGDVQGCTKIAGDRKSGAIRRGRGEGESSCRFAVPGGSRWNKGTSGGEKGSREGSGGVGERGRVAVDSRSARSVDVISELVGG